MYELLKKELCYGYTISKWLVWPEKIKRAGRKIMKDTLTNFAIFRRPSETSILNSRILNGSHSWNLRPGKVHIHYTIKRIKLKAQILALYREAGTEIYQLAIFEN